MKVLQTLPQHDLLLTSEASKKAESLGYNMLITMENRHEPFLALGIAATSTKNIALVLIFAIGLKMLQEYILHVWRFLDNYRAVDVVESFIGLFG